MTPKKTIWLILGIVFLYLIKIAGLALDQPIENRLKAMKPSEQIRWLIVESKKIGAKNLKATADLLKRAQKISFTINKPPLQVESTVELGNLYFYSGKMKEAKEYFDSALVISKKANSPTLMAESFGAIGRYYLSQSRFDDALKVFLAAKSNLEKVNDRKGVAISFLNIGLSHHGKGDLASALKSYMSAYEKSKALKNNRVMSFALENIGNIFQDRGSYELALEYYLKCLRIKERLKDEGQLAFIYNCLGITYDSLDQVKKAEKYFKLALNIYSKLNEARGIAYAHHNLGSLYSEMKLWDKALAQFNSSLKIKSKVGDKYGLASSYEAMGQVYIKIGNLSKAEETLRKGLKLYLEIDDRLGLATMKSRFGELLFLKKQYKESESELKEGLQLATDLKAKSLIVKFNYLLSKLYSLQKRFQESIGFFKRASVLEKEMLNEKKLRYISDMDVKYQTDKKEKENQILKQQGVIKELALQKQKSLNLLLIIGSLITIIFGIVFFALFRTKKQLSVMLIKKNEQISEINRKLLDSINFAETIQHAILPESREISDLLGEHFVLYHPKDIVSGDFYWFNRVGKYRFAAVVDCVGHGVPGALLSMVGNSLLNYIVIEKRIIEPDQILTHLNSEFLQMLDRKESDSKVYGGMDICLLRFNEEDRSEVIFCGAKRPLLYVEDGVMKSVKGIRKSIGSKKKVQTEFKNQLIRIVDNAVFYLFSDGYQDQNNKLNEKFGSKKLADLLLETSSLNMDEQLKKLEFELMNFSDGTEQRDDITLIGIRI